MKRIGYYKCRVGDKTVRRYYRTIREIPDTARKAVVFGPTGYGKVTMLIEGAVRKNKHVLFISTHSAEMDIKTVRLSEQETVGMTECSKISADFQGKMHYDLGQIPTVKQKEYFNSVMVPRLKESGITDRTDVTIIFEELPWLREDGAFMKEMDDWKCKVILDFTCVKANFEMGEFGNTFHSSKGWTKIPVFTRLF